MPGLKLADRTTQQLLAVLNDPPSVEQAMAAIQILLDRYGEYIYGSALTFLRGDVAAAEDAFQEAVLRFLEAWQKGKFKDPIRSFSKLLITMTRRAAIDSQRKHGRLEALPEILPGEVAAYERQLTLRALMETLPEADQLLLMETVVLGRTSAEAAEQLGISAQNVRQRSHRALKRLRSQLKEDERGWPELRELGNDE